VILSKREHYILLATVLVLGVLLLDRYGLTPIFERRARLETETNECLVQLEKAKKLFQKNRKLSQKWNEMTALGLGSDASAAESRLLHAVRDWAQEAGISLSSVKTERSETERQFRRITFRATGTGPMLAVSKFLWKVETANLPVRIADLQVSSRKEGADDLSFQLGISTLYIEVKAENPAGSLNAIGSITKEVKE